VRFACASSAKFHRRRTVGGGVAAGESAVFGDGAGVRCEFHGHGRGGSGLRERVGRGVDVVMEVGAVDGGGDRTPTEGTAEGGELVENTEGDNVGFVLVVEEIGESLEAVRSSVSPSGYRGATQYTTSSPRYSSFDVSDTEASADTPVYP
jgi:hypothetical protein